MSFDNQLPDDEMAPPDHGVFSQPGSPDMVLAGSELVSHGLPQSRRGYDVDAVDRLLARAARTVDSLYEQVWRATDEHNRLLNELEELRRAAPAEVPAAAVAPDAPESARILAAADRTAGEVLAQANAEAEIIRARAAQERARGEAEISEVRRQAQEALRRAQADAASRRAELADEVRDAEADAVARIAEVDNRIAEATSAYERRRSELETELARLQGSATKVRQELTEQLEAFRTHARNERDAAVLALVEMAESLRGFDPSTEELVVPDVADEPPAVAPPAPVAAAPTSPLPWEVPTPPWEAPAPVEAPAWGTPAWDAPAEPSVVPTPTVGAQAADPAPQGAWDAFAMADQPRPSWDSVVRPADEPAATEPERRRLWSAEDQAPPAVPGQADPVVAPSGEDGAGPDLGYVVSDEEPPPFRQVDAYRPGDGFTQVPEYRVPRPGDPEE